MDKIGFRGLASSLSHPGLGGLKSIRLSGITRLVIVGCIAVTGLLCNSQATAAPDSYHGVGVNYFDAFLRTLRNPGDDSYRDGFRKLGANHIPFARFAACGYYPNDYQLYLKDKQKYF